MQTTNNNPHFQSVAVTLLTLLTAWLLLPHCMELASGLMQGLGNQIHEMNGHIEQLYAAHS